MRNIFGREVISIDKLRNSVPANLIRLARSLNLDTTGMDHLTIASAVFMAISIPPVRFDTPEKRSDYEAFWENVA